MLAGGSGDDRRVAAPMVIRPVPLDVTSVDPVTDIKLRSREMNFTDPPFLRYLLQLETMVRIGSRSNDVLSLGYSGLCARSRTEQPRRAR